MATGVKPRDEEPNFTRADLEAIQDAMKSKKFRELLNEYCDEVRDPANQAIYQKEMTQLEKERGYDVTFINPKGSYVIKTSVAGDRKAFINICSNENVEKPSCRVQEINGQKGMNWQLPYTLIPPREDFDHNKQRCVIYDVVFHPDTLRMAEVNKKFRELVNKSAFDGLQKTYNIHLDSNNCRFPKSYYKGMSTAAVIRKEDPNFKPVTDEENEELSEEVINKLYPQHLYPDKKEPQEVNTNKTIKEHRKKAKNCHKDYSHASENGYTVPKYVIKQQKNVDMQEFTNSRDCKHYSAIPSHIVVEINMPLISSTQDCSLDVREKRLSLISEKPAKYKLELELPYPVDSDCGNARFDKSKHTLTVTLPVIRKSLSSTSLSLKGDSGVESEDTSNSDEECKTNLVEEISSTPSEPTMSKSLSPIDETGFLDSSIGYTLPPYTYNALDDILAFTFHVKNTEPDSVKVKHDKNSVYIKFSSLGSGFVPLHYAALIVFKDEINLENVSGEAWDNNVILQLEVLGNLPEKFQIGLTESDMKTECFDLVPTKQIVNTEELEEMSEKDTLTPLIEVTNFGKETNIVVSSKSNEDVLDEDDDDEENEKEIVWTESFTNTGAKSILRKSMPMMRSFSESSAGDVASSMDYISSDYIHEESSLKKTVRFNDVIAKQFYRYNSSIEGQKKKNQRKKSKKRNLERRKSESEAEDDTSNSLKFSKPRKAAIKQRHDSGVPDTSDAEESKNIMSDSDLYSNQYDENANENTIKTEKTKNIDSNGNKNFENWQKGAKPLPQKKQSCDSIKHNTNLYDPNRLNKGQYLEVQFKNDLIFDLDM
ncbi:unnamed protein product [Danaus chrysippus]|uniref:Protein kintoun n=1 Tax=Danaus chrysippus TaxID=151541 RepID=A0A8J2WBI0_9NEOP|nr:unnamed protein product [Danaus chrysippus]